ncbi:S46 family peptidase, partial [Bacteroides fragilis]
SLSGDINFDNNLQRCINLDIRYVLFLNHIVDGRTLSGRNHFCI